MLAFENKSPNQARISVSAKANSRLSLKVAAENSKVGQMLIETDEAMVDPVSHKLHDNQLLVSSQQRQGSNRKSELAVSLPISGENYLLNPSEH